MAPILIGRRCRAGGAYRPLTDVGGPLFANGGQLSASNAEVWNCWATVYKGMKWIFKKDAPLLVNMKPSWHKLSWFAEFIASIPRYESNTIATAKLAIQARDHLFAWAQQENIDFDLKKEGILHIYRDKAGFDHAAKVSTLLAAGGLTRRMSVFLMTKPNLLRADSVWIDSALPAPQR